MFHLMKSENDFALVIFDKFNTPTLSISKTASKTNKMNGVSKCSPPGVIVKIHDPI